jgi:hypothetical protein
MHVLRNYVDRIEGLAGFVEDAARNAVTQGVELDINPIWLNVYHMERTGLLPDWFNLFFNKGLSIFETGIGTVFGTVEGDAIDFSWRPKRSSFVDFMSILSGSSFRGLPASAWPFMVKIIAQPVGPDQAEARGQLVQLARSQPFFALVETRPMGRLAASPGEACLAGNVPGTIGGFLRDDSNDGTVYAATCGHVVSKGTKVNSAGKSVGTCSHSHPPVLLDAAQWCTPNCPNANTLDFALIPITRTNANVKNVVTGIATEIGVGQQVVLRGGMTGVNSFEVGGLVMIYRPGNSNVCFKNLFALRPISSGGILNSLIRNALATVPKQGDSGAWVETASPSEWCGVLVATDSTTGYALEADAVIAEANAEFDTQLVLV